MAALLGGGVLGSGIGVSGNRELEYWIRERDDDSIVFNNVENINRQSDIESVYDTIGEKLGIPVIELFYVPKGMLYKNASLSEDRVKSLYTKKIVFIFIKFYGM